MYSSFNSTDQTRQLIFVIRHWVAGMTRADGGFLGARASIAIVQIPAGVTMQNLIKNKKYRNTWHKMFSHFCDKDLYHGLMEIG